MNEYTARAMLIDISAGQRIIVVERNYRALREAVRVIAAENESINGGATVRIANGAERVDYPDGGWIRFATPLGTRMRGLTADVVFIDNDAPRVIASSDRKAFDRFGHDIAGVLATGGRVVHS